MKIKESPGRKKPISNPVSEKITTNNSANPPKCMMDSGLVSVFRNSQKSFKSVFVWVKIKKPRRLFVSEVKNYLFGNIAKLFFIDYLTAITEISTLASRGKRTT